jgi:Asp-tRNA(Asn)/Glu-tRNA(Gln) amidotransferase A subunit family amidase
MPGAAEAARSVRLGQLSPLDLVEESLRSIDALDGVLQAWVHVDRAGTLLVARERYEGARHGTAVGKLIGIPVGIKDIIDVDGMPTRAGASDFAHRLPERAAPVIERLRYEGAIILGKTATTQFAYLDPSPTRNPWNPEHTPGGSSSGSAAAVASGMIPLALGTQTVGSVLRPAAYCGIAGLKPTHGLVSTAGILPLAPSLDHVGVFARSVADAALALSVIADPDGAAAAITTATPDSLPSPSIGALRGFGDERVSDEVKRHIESIAERLAAAGAAIHDIPSPFSIADVQAISTPILRYEAAQYHRPLYAEHGDEYAPQIRGLIEAGLQMPESAYIDAKARQSEFRVALSSLLEGLDALLLPVAPSTAPKGLGSTGDASFCAPASTAGLPSIALPTALGEGGLPLAVQLVGRAFEEPALLGVAAWVEAQLASDARPPL